MLRFRAPGSSLPASTLVARVLGEDARAAAARVRAGALEDATGRVRDGETRILPGTALRLAVAPPPLELPQAHVWSALVPALPWPSGRGEGFRYWTAEARDGLARLGIELDTAALDTVRAWLATAGSPVLGDAAHGGIAVDGGLRLAPSEAAPLAWPDEAVFPASFPASDGVLRISPGTARALTRGHPWVIADDRTEAGDRFAPGTHVALRDARGRFHGTALTEGGRSIAARRWSGASDREGGDSVAERVARALARRAPLVDGGGDTDAVRLVHGEADGLPGLAVDRFGPVLRLLVSGRAALGLREAVIAALRAEALPGLGTDPAIVEVMHLPDRPPGRLEAVRLLAGCVPDPLVVREGRLRFAVDLGLAEPERPRPGVGFFLDQRENRRRVGRRMAGGGRALNLFAHTGGFTAALLAGGAEAVTSVDLSGPYLKRLEENLGRSGLPLARHVGVRREARRVLAELPARERFRGIVIDPPTAAAAGRRFWNVRRDLGPLTAAALARLEPGGFLLLTRQDRARRRGLEGLVKEAATSARVRLARVERAPAGADFPALEGFPEGAPFEGILATRA